MDVPTLAEVVGGQTKPEEAEFTQRPVSKEREGKQREEPVSMSRRSIGYTAWC